MKKTLIALAGVGLCAVVAAILTASAPNLAAATTKFSGHLLLDRTSHSGGGKSTTTAFSSASAGINSNGFFYVTFKEVGLIAGESVNYGLQVEQAATYACLSGGGAKGKKQAPGVYDEVPASPVNAFDSATASNTGVVTAGMAIAPPQPDNPTICPAGETLTLANVAYANPTLTDTTNGISADLTGTCTTAAPCSDTFIPGYPNALLP